MIITSSGSTMDNITYDAIKTFDSTYVYWSRALDAATPPPTVKLDHGKHVRIMKFAEKRDPKKTSGKYCPRVDQR